MTGLDLFTAEGAPWARFFLAKRKADTAHSRPRQGSMQTCVCGRTFVRTDPDPRALQACQTCDHDRREALAPERRRAPEVVSINRKRSRRA